MSPEHEFGARAGDHVLIESHRLRGARRVGEILEVLGEPGDAYYRVRWSDGHVSLYHPGSDAVVPEAEERERLAAPAAETAPPKPGAARRQPVPAAAAPTGTRARAGDRLVIRHHHVGEPDRDAEILEVLGADGRPPYRVRWSDSGREAILRPGPDAFVDELSH